MADINTNNAPLMPPPPPPSTPTGVRAPESRFGLGVGPEKRPPRERKEGEIPPEKLFDADFDELKKYADALTVSTGATPSGDGFVVTVSGFVVDKIEVRKIPQDLRFDAAPDRDLQPRYEITIYYASQEGNMADTLTVALEDLYLQSFTEEVKVIHRRLIEAHRVSAKQDHDRRVQAIHDALEISVDGSIEHEVSSTGDDVTHPYDYDRVVEIEVKTAVDAIKSVMELGEMHERIVQA